MDLAAPQTARPDPSRSWSQSETTEVENAQAPIRTRRGHGQKRSDADIECRDALERLNGALDEEALAREIPPHLAMMRQISQRILGCPDLAQDAVQEAIVALWKLRDRPPELRGWLAKTVIHRSLHRRRTEMRRRRWEDEAATAENMTCPLCDPEDEVGRRRLVELVEATVACLADEHRVVIALRSQGLDYEEIARQLGLPIGTVRSRLSRARRALRDRLPGLEL